MTTANWTPASTKPEPGVRVLVTILDITKPRVGVARLIPQYFQRCSADNFEGECDYDGNDESYWPEGWYADQDDTGRSWAVADPVLAWAPLPAPYVPGGAA